MKNIKNNFGRRNFIGKAAITAAGFAIFPGQDANGGEVNKITISSDLSIFNVCNFGVRGDGATINTKAIQSLIDSCSNKGGGTVFFPPGDFITGTFQMKDNVSIYLSPGATIWGSTNQTDYHHDCLVYAEKAKNISISGRGVINGNGPAFWKKYTNDQGEIKWGYGEWRPDWMFVFVECENLFLEDFTIEKSPSWTIHPIDCDKVKIRGISILNGLHEDDGPNTDGINPDGCSNVIISDCLLHCGDDCIVLKITEKSKTRVCKDIVVTNCVLQTSQTGLKIGTETHGIFRNITFSNCVVHDSGGGFGLIMRDGGLIDGMVVSNITVDNTHPNRQNGQGIYIWSHKRTEDTPFGMIKNVLISNMTIRAGGGIFITGAKEKRIEGLTFENIRIHITGGRHTSEHENPSYPFTVFGHFIAPYDVFCRYVDDLKLRNIQLIWPDSEEARFGSALRCWSVNNLDIDGFSGRQSLQSKSPAISLRNVKGTFIHNCKSPEGTGTVLQLEKGTEKVTIIGNEFSQAKELLSAQPGIARNEIFETGNALPREG